MSTLKNNEQNEKNAKNYKVYIHTNIINEKKYISKLFRSLYPNEKNMLVLLNKTQKGDGKTDGDIMISLVGVIFGKQFKNMGGIILDMRY